MEKEELIIDSLDIQDGEPSMDVDLPVVDLPSIQYSITPTLDVLPKGSGPAPPDLVKEGRGLVPRSADMDPIYIKFIEGLAPATEIKAALAHLGTDKAMRFLIELCKLEKRFGQSSKTIVRAAKRAGIGMDTMAEMWRSHSTALAMMKIVSATPKLADDLVEASTNKPIVCPACQGEGILEMRLGDSAQIECPQCHGQRYIIRAGDRYARGHLLEWAGAINQPNKSGPGVGSQQVYLNLVLPRK